MGLRAHALMAQPLQSGAQFPRGGLRARGAGAWGWGEQSHCRLLTPSTRYSLVSCGSWALAFRQLMAWWSHPATSRRLPPSRPSRGGLVGSSIICSSLFFLRGEDENKSPGRRQGGLWGAVSAVALPAPIYIPFPRFTPREQEGSESHN